MSYFILSKMNVERTWAQRRVCIGTDKKSVHILNRRYATNLYYRPISTYDDPIIPIVLMTLDVIIGCANVGTILDRRKSFLLARRFSTLLHNVWCTT